jgi:hypothetical protein
MVIVLAFLLGGLLAGCAHGPPRPDWVPTTITPAEQAEAECRNSSPVGQVRFARAFFGGPRSPERDAMDACMALKGFKRN